MTQRKCVKKKCHCKIGLQSIARKNEMWEHAPDDLTLVPSSSPKEENSFTSNSLVLMNLGDKFGKKILEAKKIATANANDAHGVLKLDTSPETIQALIRFTSD